MAATSLVGHVILSTALTWVELDEVRDVGLRLFYLAFCITAMRGTYAWHKAYAEVGGERSA